MDKTTEAFRTIGEVAEELDLPQHVLRFWETKFTQIRPVKRAGGRRYYRPDDIQLVAAIRLLLYSEGYTIKGVQRILKEQGARAVVAASSAPRGGAVGAFAVGASSPVAAPFVAASAPAVAARPAAEAPKPLIQSEPSAELGPAIRPEPTAPASASHPAPVAAASGVTRLSTEDRHRLEAILAELTECGRLLA
jgi:DNA-binding transcriptional MerR regulator